MSLQSLIPPAPRRGQPLDAAWGAKIVECLRALCPTSTSGLLLSQGTLGVRYSRRFTPARRAGTAPAVSQAPVFLCPQLTADKDGKPAWTVTPGTVNSVVPHIGGTELTALDKDGAPPCVTVAGECGIWLRCAAPANAWPTEIEIVAKPLAEIPEDSDDVGWFCLGRVVAVPATSPAKYVVFAFNAVSRQCYMAGGKWFNVGDSASIYNVTYPAPEVQL